MTTRAGAGSPRRSRHSCHAPAGRGPLRRQPSATARIAGKQQHSSASIVPGRPPSTALRQAWTLAARVHNDSGLPPSPTATSRVKATASLGPQDKPERNSRTSSAAESSDSPCRGCLKLRHLGTLGRSPAKRRELRLLSRAIRGLTADRQKITEADRVPLRNELADQRRQPGNSPASHPRLTPRLRSSFRSTDRAAAQPVSQTARRKISECARQRRKALSSRPLGQGAHAGDGMRAFRVSRQIDPPNRPARTLCDQEHLDNLPNAPARIGGDEHVD